MVCVGHAKRPYAIDGSVTAHGMAQINVGADRRTSSHGATGVVELSYDSSSARRRRDWRGDSSSECLDYIVVGLSIYV